MRRAAATAVFLLAVYWLTASGAFHSIDEHAVFAVGRGLVYQGTVDQSALFWAAPYDEQARVGLDGELYSKYGIGHSLLVALMVLIGRAVPGAGIASTAMLLNGWATAACAFFLVLSASRLGYSPTASTAVALLFGLSTFAWVYAKTLFSEPLVALVWTATVWLLLADGRPRRTWLAGAVLAAGVAVRPVSLLIVPFFVPLLWTTDRRELARRLVALAAPVALVCAGLLAFNWWRFGDPLEFGYNETFGGSLLAGLTGFLFSLDRSIFLFAPPLVALIWSLPAFLHGHGSLGWKLLAIAGANLLLYSAWPVFWGGPVWGPRYLLPALPLLMLLLAPAAEQALSQGGWRRWALLALAVAGVLIQLPAVIWNPLPLTQSVGQRYPLWMLQPQGDWLDVAWLSGHAEGAKGAAVAAAVGLLALVALLWPRRWLTAVVLLATAPVLLLLASWLGQGGHGYRDAPAYRAAVAQLEESGRPGDALVLNPAPYQAPYEELVWFLNTPRATMPFFGVHRLPPGQDQPSRARITALLDTHPRLWLLTQGVAPGDPASTAELALTQQGFLAGTQWLEDGYRLTRFEAARPVTRRGAPRAELGQAVVLEEWQAAWEDQQPSSVQVTLHWLVTEPTGASIHTFVQVLDRDGQPVAAYDGVPGGGYAPSSAWRAGDQFVERIALPLPSAAQPFPLRVIVGMYDTDSGQRLATPTGVDALDLLHLE